MQLGILLAIGVDGHAWRHADLGSARNDLATSASAFCHVSAKKLVEETQYSRGPTIAAPHDKPAKGGLFVSGGAKSTQHFMLF